MTVFSQDPGLDEWTVTIDWGDGSQRDIHPIFDPSFVISHIYADNGKYPLKVKVDDDDGGSGSAEVDAEVQNVDPSLWIKGMRSVDEGTELSITDIGMFTDPGFDNPDNPLQQPGGSHETATLHIDWDDGSPEDSIPGSVDFLGSEGLLTRGTFDAAHTYADNDRYDRVRLWTIDDDGGNSDYRFMTIIVNNVTPYDVQPTLAESEINEGEYAHLTVTFVDPGMNDTHTARINWGDGSPIDEFSVGPAGTRTFTREHPYADDDPSGTPWDIATITVTIFDDDEGESCAWNGDPSCRQRGADRGCRCDRPTG